MSYFSGQVLLGDLDDFIAPAQVCSTGLFSDAPSSTGGSTQLVMEDDFDETFASSQANIIRTSAAKIASVTLEDCLACNGCVTSAETILIQQQSISTFADELKKKEYKVYVVVVSRPACVSIAEKLSISVDEAYKRICSTFYSLGVDIVVKQDVAEHISMIESIAEYKNRKLSTAKPDDYSTQSSYAVNKDVTIYPKENQLIGAIDLDNVTTSNEHYEVLLNNEYHHNPASQPHIDKNAPYITSNCPGWVCYAEKKTHMLVPYLSTVRSAQQIMGSLLRELLPKHIKAEITSDDIYITSIVSCYDRKLEASRRDFIDENHKHQINCVLSSQECFELLEKSDNSRDSSELEWDEEWWQSIERINNTNYDSALMSSGGVLRAVVESVHAAYPQSEIKTKTVRNNDYVEVIVDNQGEKVFSGAFIYGFRNIQNLVMKMKRRKCLYDIVEVMACPSGCLNGGGQIKPEKREDMMRIASELSAYYVKGGKPFEYEHLKELIEPLYKELQISVGDDMAYALFHTRFHIIPEITINSLHW